VTFTIEISMITVLKSLSDELTFFQAAPSR